LNILIFSSHKTVGQRVYPFVKYKEWTFLPWPCIERDPEEYFKQLKNFKSKDGDILFCSSPKSGKVILYNIYNVCICARHIISHIILYDS